jgi:hypothetical protein
VGVKLGLLLYEKNDGLRVYGNRELRSTFVSKLMEKNA